MDSGVIKWCREALLNYNFKPVDLTVSLLVKDTDTLTSGNGKPLQTLLSLTFLKRAQILLTEKY